MINSPNRRFSHEETDYCINNVSGTCRSFLTGGTVFATGSTGMIQDLGADPKQNYIVAAFQKTMKAGTTVTLKAGDEVIRLMISGPRTMKNVLE